MIRVGPDGRRWGRCDPARSGGCRFAGELGGALGRGLRAALRRRAHRRRARDRRARSTTRAEPPSNRRRISRRMKAAVGSRRRPRSADHFISHVRSEDGYRPSSRACASTTCATRPWPSPPGRTRRRSPTAWATRQSPSPWTATGTCSHRRRGAGRRPGRPAPARGPEGNVIPIGAAE